MATETLNHTYRHFADLQMSSKDFYDRVEAEIAGYEYPDIRVQRVELSVGGFFSARRQYLCVSRENLAFYVCAAPYGRSFFISWWFQYERSAFLDWLYESRLVSALFEEKTKTMFRQDTRLMFQNGINSIITELAGSVQPEQVKRRTPPLVAQPLS